MLMRRLITVLLVMLGVALPARAATVEERIAAELQAQGYEIVEANRTWLGRLRFVAETSQIRREIVVNPGTGEILRDYSVLLSTQEQRLRAGSSNEPRRPPAAVSGGVTAGKKLDPSPARLPNAQAPDPVGGAGADDPAAVPGPVAPDEVPDPALVPEAVAPEVDPDPALVPDTAVPEPADETTVGEPAELPGPIAAEEEPEEEDPEVAIPLLPPPLSPAISE
jgi:hypothetical protein